MVADPNLEPGAGTTNSSGLGRTALLNSARLSMALVVSWILALAGRFLLPNVLGTEKFGELAFIESIAVLAMSVMAFGAGDYIRKEVTARPEHAKQFARPLRRLQLFVGLVLSAGLLVAMTSLSGIQLGVVALAFGLSQVALILGLMNAAYLQARHDVRVVSISAIVTKALWFAILLLVLGAGFELMALPVALLVSETVRTTWTGRAVRATYGVFPAAPRGAARGVLKLSLPYYVNALNVQFMGYSVRILVGLIGGTLAIGYFAPADLASTVPLLLTAILGWIAIPVFTSVRERGGPSQLWERVGQMLDLLAVVACAVAVALFALSDWLMPLLFGAEFEPSGPAFAFLALSIPATYFTQIVGSAFIADDRSWRNTQVNVVTMMLVFVGVVAALWISGSDDPGKSAWLAAIVIAAGEWITVIVLWLLRPFRWLAAQTAVRLFLLACALVMAAVEKLGDGSTTLLLASVGLAIGVALTDVPRLVTQGRDLLRARGGDGGDSDQAAGNAADEDTDPLERLDLLDCVDGFDPPKGQDVAHASEPEIEADTN